jgi:hypothetical protein
MVSIFSRGALLLLCLCAVVPAFAQSRGITLEPAQRVVATPYADGIYRALVIGNNDYRDPAGRWPVLKTAIGGARALSDLLRAQYGFADVQVLENATRRDILLALNEMARRVLPNDSVLVYYAGHGYLDADTGRGYWVPVDAQGTDITTFLRNSTIRDEVGVIAERARHTLLLSDSCFSGTLLRSETRGLKANGDGERYYEKVAAKKSVQVITAGGVEFVDDDYRDSGHSPFTYFLVNELRHNNSSLLTLSELSTNVEKAVANNVTQVPQSGVLQGAGDELGEFIFLNVNVEVTGVPRERVRVNVNVMPEASAAPRPVAPPATAPVTEPPQRLMLPLPTL